MLFPTVSFAVFFALVLPASWLLMPRRTWWKLFMVAASWFFYGCAGWGFVPLLATSTVVNHFLTFRLDRASPESKRWWAGLAVAVNLAGLGWFKYIAFFSTSTTSILNYLGLGVHLAVPKVLLPAGISFFTFQAISYVIDVKRGQIRPVGLLDFAVYLSFFPHLLAGPIVRASEFLPQIRYRADPRRVDAGTGLWLISRGLFKKVVIASYLASHAADPLFGVPAQHAGIEALFGVYAYALQIYADFSGYTDIAIGLALLLGVRFPQNFNSPYRALSLQEFWRRWHMTLSRFLRDYLYIPLGGNRRGEPRTYVNIMATMLLGGLWHGAAWTFVAWGGLHGTGLALERAQLWHRSRRLIARAGLDPAAEVETAAPAAAVGAVAADAGAADAATAPTDSRSPVLDPAMAATATAMGLERRPSRHRNPVRPVLAWAVTFHVVCLGWIFFRATSFANAGRVLGRIFSTGPHVHLNLLVVAVVAGCLVAQWLPVRASSALQAWFVRLSIGVQSLVLAGVLVVIDAFGPAGVAPFIYFRF